MSAILQSPPASLAPWAEVVPDSGPVAVDHLLTMPDDGYQYEVVEGTLVRMAGSGGEASGIAALLLAELLYYTRARRLGRITGADGVYKFPGAATGLVPDVAFYGVEHFGEIRDLRRLLPFAPDLAVEVVSPDQRPDGMAAKARRYLGAGTRLVWVLWPSSQHVDVWRAGHPSGPVATLNASNSLEGEDVIPGFRIAVVALFADPMGDSSDAGEEAPSHSHGPTAT